MVGRLVVGLVVSACGDDTTQGQDQDNATGDGDGDSGDAGRRVAQETSPMASWAKPARRQRHLHGGTCASELTGGTLGRLGDPLPAPNGFWHRGVHERWPVVKVASVWNGVRQQWQCRRQCGGTSGVAKARSARHEDLNFEGDAGARLEQFKAANTCRLHLP